MTAATLGFDLTHHETPPENSDFRMVRDTTYETSPPTPDHSDFWAATQPRHRPTAASLRALPLMFQADAKAARRECETRAVTDLVLLDPCSPPPASHAQISKPKKTVQRAMAAAQDAVTASGTASSGAFLIEEQKIVKKVLKRVTASEKKK